MSNPCYYHSPVPAVGSCIQCGTPICGDCQQIVGGKSACKRCADALKARFAQQTAPIQPNYSPQAGSGIPGAPAPQTYRAVSEKSSASQMLTGIVLGGFVGIIGAIIIEKILFYAHFGLSLLYVALGYGIGWGIHRVTGRGGPGLALTAVGVMIASLCVSHLVWAQDILNLARSEGNVDPGMTLFDAFPLAMATLGIMHWVCIIFGLLACYRGVEQQQ